MDERICYRSHPLRDDGPRALAAVAAVVGIPLAVGATFGETATAVAAGAILLVSLARYFAPTTYTLDGDGVRARFLGREDARPWSEVRALYAHRDGVHLSPFARPSPLDPFRGLFVRFAGNRDQVLSFCEKHVARAA